MGRPNLPRGTKFSGANGDRENVHFHSSADQEQDWQPRPVDPNSAISDGNVYIHTYYRHAMSVAYSFLKQIPYELLYFAHFLFVYRSKLHLQ